MCKKISSHLCVENVCLPLFVPPRDKQNVTDTYTHTHSILYIWIAKHIKSVRSNYCNHAKNFCVSNGSGVLSHPSRVSTVDWSTFKLPRNPEFSFEVVMSSPWVWLGGNNSSSCQKLRVSSTAVQCNTNMKILALSCLVYGEPLMCIIVVIIHFRQRW